MTESLSVLGFDYGSKKIGVAVGDTGTATASPLCTVKFAQNSPDWRAIEGLLDTWQPGALVVGLPLNMDGTAHAMTESARRFSRQLQGRYQLPIHLVDERLSSIEAQGRLDEAGRGKKDLDPVAAQIILETWFEQANERDKD